ncbi:MAG TPA: hypothetical protein VKE74_08090 [Gemmataceae bacterium]|nr:hypothetical protein [Gemmataceae bacterium]
MEEKPKKAKLVEVGPDGEPVSDGVEVQFNPETLKVTYANQITQTNTTGSTTGGGDNKSVPQFAGVANNKLALQLFFDVTGELPQADAGTTDVRVLTKKVAYFITLKQSQTTGTPPAPPKVRFAWGSFQFDGVVESMDESLELFSSDGHPLRATVSLSIQGTDTLKDPTPAAPPAPPGALSGPGGPPGVRPLTLASAGASIQQLAAGAGAAWQDIAAANGIENPRFLQVGQAIDVNVSVQAGASVRFGG